VLAAHKILYQLNNCRSIAFLQHQVCLRSCPLYHPGSIGFNISSGIPRMGQLLESAWNLDEKCRFKVLPLGNEESPNPPLIDEQDSDVPGSLGLSEFNLVEADT